MSSTTEPTHRWGNNTRQSNQQSGRENILDAAIACYHDRGVAGTTIDDIAAEAKISRRTIYRYFANKQAVVQAVVERQAADFFDELRQAVRRYRGDFPALLKRCMLYTIEHGPRAPGHGLMMGKADNVAMSSQHYFASQTIKQAWADLLRKPFQQALESGVIAADTDFEQLAAWSRRVVMSFILFPAPKQSVASDIEHYVLAPLRPLGQSSEQRTT